LICVTALTSESAPAVTNNHRASFSRVLRGSHGGREYRAAATNTAGAIEIMLLLGQNGSSSVNIAKEAPSHTQRAFSRERSIAVQAPA
jgi:hypothetical protein